jgi:four helix bundle protein
MACQLADRIDEICRQPACRASRSVVDQISDSSQSVCANIAEGFGRFSHGEFLRFLRIAHGSALETREHVRRFRSHGWITEEERRELDTLTDRAVGSIVPLMRYLRNSKGPR